MNSLIPLFDKNGIWMLRVQPLATFAERAGIWLYDEAQISITEGHTESCAFDMACKTAVAIMECGYLPHLGERLLEEGDSEAVKSIAQAAAELAILIVVLQERSNMAECGEECQARGNPHAVYSRYDH